MLAHTLSISLLLTGCLANNPPQLFSPLIPQKVQRTFNSLPNPPQYPQYTDKNVPAHWLYFVPDTWTTGFFPLTLYEMHTRQALCQDAHAGGQGIDWLNLARRASAALASLPGHNTQGHDVGFLSFPFLAELEINPDNRTAIDVVNGFANDLAARFNPTVGCTRSWDTSDPTQFTVIVDNMMNLEVLFASQDLTGNTTLGEIARSHADTTIKNHIRADGSTWHVIDYNATTGRVIDKRTAQGFSDNSTWTRGQGWAIYGFANMYKRTGKSTYLDTARRLATLFLNRLPSNNVVPWDFDAPNPDTKTGGPRPSDSSGAMVAASGLLLLSDVETDQGNAQKWIDSALKIIQGTTNLAWSPSWESLLSNGTVNWPANNYLTGIVYADYYFIKAGNELVKKGLATC